MDYIKKVFQFPQPLLKTFPVWLLIPFVLLVAADLWSKKWATDTLQFNLSRRAAALNAPLHNYTSTIQTPDKYKIDVLGENGKYIRFRLAFNDQFAFSIGPSDMILGIAISFFAVLFLIFFRAHNHNLGHPVAWLFIFSGAIGNLVDKMFIHSLTTRDWMFSLSPQKGYVNGVVDFIDCIWFGYPWDRWPTFNIADSLVTSGVIVLAIGILLAPPEELEKKK